MVGAKRLRHLVLERAFVVLGVVEGHRERVEAERRHPGRQRAGDRGIEPTGQIGADRHVGAHPEARCILEQGSQFGGVLCPRPFRPGVVAIGKIERPPQALPPPVGVGDGQLSRLQLTDAGEGGARSDRRPQREDLVEGDRIEFEPEAGNGGQRLDLGGEPQPAGVLGVIERPHAHAIAGQQQAAAAGVVEGKGEIAVELVEEVVALELVEGQQHFRVGGGQKTPAARHQFGAQFDVVEDLAVEDDGQRPLGVAERLGAVTEADDGQAGVAETDRRPAAVPLVDVNAIAVRATMDDGRHHGMGQSLIVVLVARSAEPAGQTAHRCSPLQMTDRRCSRAAANRFTRSHPPPGGSISRRRSR